MNKKEIRKKFHDNFSKKEEERRKLLEEFDKKWRTLDLELELVCEEQGGHDFEVINPMTIGGNITWDGRLIYHCKFCKKIKYGEKPDIYMIDE